MKPDISIVIPIYNEEENVAHLLASIFTVLPHVGKSYEIVAVDDGSRDRSFEILRSHAETHSTLRVLRLVRNSGQTAALMAGIEHATGDVIVTMDADLQNDPGDIPLLLAKLEEGFDVVSGWRVNRRDAAIRRNFVSRIANWIISRISGVALHDYGCTLKAYRSTIARQVRLYGEMHRFIPIYGYWLGARVTEVPVQHHPRRFGKSKYGLERIFKVILDLMLVKFFDRHMVKPIYVFGGVGLLFFFMSIILLLYTIFNKVVYNISMIQTPLTILSGLLGALAVVSILMGILAEIMIRTYFETGDRRPYLIAERVNFSGEP